MDATKTLLCSICYGDFPEGSKGIKCSCNHFHCNECSPIYIITMFNNYSTLIPAKCSDLNCKGEIKFSDIEEYMTKDQVTKYNEYLKIKDIPEDCKMMSCPLGCEYWEIVKKSDLSNLFYCKNENCGKGTCLVCGKQFIYPKDALSFTTEEKMLYKSEDLVDYHKEECSKLMVHIKTIHEIIENGNVRTCPSCGTRSRKNDGCNRIPCVNCKKNYCYFCGKAEEFCDKADPKAYFYSHCDNWKTNEKRCPCWMYQLNTVDSDWPTDDNACQDRLHKIIIYTNLREYANKIGKDIFNTL